MNYMLCYYLFFGKNDECLNVYRNPYLAMYNTNGKRILAMSFHLLYT
jgi:hypothetical protein